MIPLAAPNLSGRELEYLKECVDTNFVSSVGPFVDRFEREFASFVGSPHAVATANGTAAIHMALILAGVGPGDEVLVSDFTFAASANPIRYQQAMPVLVDSEWDTWNLDPGLVVEELERRDRKGIRQPKAVVVVHILGCPAQIEPIVDACGRYGVWLIEDAAEALGASYSEGRFQGRQVGTIGRIGCYSFNGNKIITSGGGGMLVTADAELAAKAKHLTTQAKRPGYAYFHDEVGYNYRLTNLAAALGVAQLEQLPGFIARKRGIAEFYRSRIGSLGRGVTLPPRPGTMLPTYWLFSILFPGGWEAPLKAMELLQVQTRPLWTALHLMPPFSSCQRLGSGKVAEALCGRGLSLPCSTSISQAELEQVVESLATILGAAPQAG